MACRLLGAKPLSEPMLAYCYLDHWEQNPMKTQWKCNNFQTIKWTSKNFSRPQCVKWYPLCLSGGAVYDSSQPDQLGVATKSVQVYDRDTNLWARLADMYESRAYVGVTAHAGFIYAVGGEDEERRWAKHEYIVTETGMASCWQNFRH